MPCGFAQAHPASSKKKKFPLLCELFSRTLVSRKFYSRDCSWSYPLSLSHLLFAISQKNNQALVNEIKIRPFHNLIFNIQILHWSEPPASGDGAPQGNINSTAKNTDFAHIIKTLGMIESLCF